ncbi:MAG: TatD family hydrolase [Deltaproteobacteria bacterium]|nr:TatD family hydrolase [Deltaproteobacteria bacterium]
MLIDCHIHLQDKKLVNELNKLLADCQRYKINKFISAGSSERDWERLDLIAKDKPNIYPTYGIHPYSANNKTPTWLNDIEKYLSKNAVAIGEIGLDRLIKSCPFDIQEDVFTKQWELAYKLRLPAVLHCVHASDWLLSILKKLPALQNGFMLHSYTGSKEDTFKLLDKGAYFSFSGIVFKPSKTKLREILKIVPADRLLIETDAPYIPLPKEKSLSEFLSYNDLSLNHPANLLNLFNLIAQERLQDPLELEEIVWHNALRLFSQLKQA